MMASYATAGLMVLWFAVVWIVAWPLALFVPAWHDRLMAVCFPRMVG